MRLLRKFLDFALALGAFVGLLYLPKDVKELPEALKDWGFALTLDRETLLFVFAGLLVLYIGWMDLRPMVRDWQEKRNGVNAKPFPLLALMEQAKRDGWLFEGQPFLRLDFLDALNEAGARKLLVFHGRKIGDHLFDDMIRSEPRTPVAPEEWANLEVSPDAIVTPETADNFVTRLMLKRPYGQQEYADIHFDRQEAMKWLRTYAPEFKGRRADSQSSTRTV